jgi:hypothetical protein
MRQRELFEVVKARRLSWQAFTYMLELILSKRVYVRSSPRLNETIRAVNNIMLHNYSAMPGCYSAGVEVNPDMSFRCHTVAEGG